MVAKETDWLRAALSDDYKPKDWLPIERQDDVGTPPPCPSTPHESSQVIHIAPAAPLAPPANATPPPMQQPTGNANTKQIILWLIVGIGAAILFVAVTLMTICLALLS